LGEKMPGRIPTVSKTSFFMKVSIPRGACKRLTDIENTKRFIDKKNSINKIQRTVQNGDES
jgi:hypothetical protein